jgi:hypothetical protein
MQTGSDGAREYMNFRAPGKSERGRAPSGIALKSLADFCGSRMSGWPMAKI